MVGEIGVGHLLFVGFKASDTTDHVEWMADKVVGLRIFQDDAGKMNRTLADVDGSILVVSQFTLYGPSVKADARASSRPHPPRPRYRCTTGSWSFSSPATRARWLRGSSGQ